MTYFDNKPITITGQLDEESRKQLEKMASLPDEIKIKIVEIYNYMAKSKSGKIVLKFDTGIKMICEIDSTEWNNPPKIDLNEVMKDGRR